MRVQRWRPRAGAVTAFLLMLAYAAAGRFGLSLYAVGGFAAPVWPPAGIALGALLMLGAGLWPAVAMGALFVNRMAGAPWPVAFMIAGGNTLEVLVAVYLLRQSRPRRLLLDRPQDVLDFFWKAGLLSPFLSATIGVGTLGLVGMIPSATLVHAWLVWWVGDALGNLTIAPAFIVWSVPFRIPFQRWKEASLLAAGMAACVWSVFRGTPNASLFGASATLVFPPLVWAAQRFGPRGATLGVLAVAAAAIWGTARGGGPFAALSPTHGLLSLQLFMAVVCVSTLLLAAEAASRRRVEAVLFDSREDLERRVGERTAELARSNGSLQAEVARKRRAEEEVRHLNHVLEARVLDRTWALEDANLRLRASLEEKETLLKEIHHRVKNNLQIVYSLINLQSRHVDDPKTLEGLRDCRERVRAMAMVHEKLYRSRDLGRINFGDYIEELTGGLAQTYGHEGVRIEVDAEGVRLGIDEAVPCGLMIHELVSNSLKHAFSGGRGGHVWVTLEHAGEAGLKLEVRDDGVGFPPGLDFQESSSLGLQLVCSLARQLSGEIRREDAHPGTAFVVTFPAAETVKLGV
jgi:two-component sensor histidine kinase/integral membrane sensor domain MASE1